jgi:hypothetical protein
VFEHLRTLVKVSQLVNSVEKMHEAWSDQNKLIGVPWVTATGVNQNRKRLPTIA